MFLSDAGAQAIACRVTPEELKRHDLTAGWVRLV
jgi:hypothetical protein